MTTAQKTVGMINERYRGSLRCFPCPLPVRLIRREDKNLFRGRGVRGQRVHDSAWRGLRMSAANSGANAAGRWC